MDGDRKRDIERHVFSLGRVSSHVHRLYEEVKKTTVFFSDLPIVLGYKDGDREWGLCV